MINFFPSALSFTVFMCVLCVDEKKKVEGNKSTILSLLKFKNSRFSKDLVREKLASLSFLKLLPQILNYSLRRCTVLKILCLYEGIWRGELVTRLRHYQHTPGSSSS